MRPVAPEGEGAGVVTAAAEKLEAVEREIKQRRRVYPRLVDQGKMTQAFADRQIAIMEAIADDYRRDVEGDRLL